MSTTTNLALTLLEENQEQAYVPVNELMNSYDDLVGGRLLSVATKTATASIVKTNHVILSNHSAAATYTLPAVSGANAPRAGQKFVVRDISSTGAGTNNITIAVPSGAKLDGVTNGTVTIVESGGWVEVVFVSDSLGYYVVRSKGIGIGYPIGMDFATGMMGSTPAYNGSHGSIDGTNPGTRESVVVGYNYRTEVPRKVYGLVLPLAGLTINTDVKIRVALAARDGQFWRGSAGVSSSLPNSLLASDSAGATMSSMRSALLGSTSARYMAKLFTTPVVIAPGNYWLLTMSECVYGSDTVNGSNFCIWGDNICYVPHEKGGTTGNSRGIAWAAVQTTAINSLAWSSFISATASNWVSASASSFTPTGRTWTGALAAWNWGVLNETI